MCCDNDRPLKNHISSYHVTLLASVMSTCMHVINNATYRISFSFFIFHVFRLTKFIFLRQFFLIFWGNFILSPNPHSQTRLFQHKMSQIYPVKFSFQSVYFQKLTILGLLSIRYLLCIFHVLSPQSRGCRLA